MCDWQGSLLLGSVGPKGSVSRLFFASETALFLLYLDESGNPEDPADRHFVMAGLAVFERRTYWLQRDTELLKSKHFPTAPPLDFHAQPIRAGKGFWRNVDLPTRQAVLQGLAKIIASAPKNEVVLFGAVVEKTAARYGEDAVRAALEQVCKRFDTLLKNKDPQRGLIVLAQSHYEQRAKTWVNSFRDLGTQWGVLSTLSDIPYSAPAKESRLLQLADYVAHALFLLYERRDGTLLAPILGRFHTRNSTIHGLVHMSDSRGPGCECPACASRHAPGTYGSWFVEGS